MLPEQLKQVRLVDERVVGQELLVHGLVLGLLLALVVPFQKHEEAGARAHVQAHHHGQQQEAGVVLLEMQQRAAASPPRPRHPSRCIGLPCLMEEREGGRVDGGEEWVGKEEEWREGGG